MTEEAFYIHKPKGILDANYRKVGLAEIAAQAAHLRKHSHTKLHLFLKKCEDLFNGILGKVRAR